MKLIQELNKLIKVDAEIERFLNEECETKVFEKGEILSKQNQYNHTVFFVDEGLLRMFYYENGKDITTNFYSEGKITANIDTLFKNQPTRNNIETLEKSVITTCNFNKLEELCSVSLTAANFSRNILGNLMIEMSRRIFSLQYMTAKEKYIQLLEENPNIILRAPLGMIASYLGISQETLSRIRKFTHHIGHWFQIFTIKNFIFQLSWILKHSFRLHSTRLKRGHTETRKRSVTRAGLLSQRKIHVHFLR
jgi:CRP-like cAMP-binding protein